MTKLTGLLGLVSSRPSKLNAPIETPAAGGASMPVITGLAYKQSSRPLEHSFAQLIAPQGVFPSDQGSGVPYTYKQRDWQSLPGSLILDDTYSIITLSGVSADTSTVRGYWRRPPFVDSATVIGDLSDQGGGIWTFSEWDAIATDDPAHGAFPFTDIDFSFKLIGPGGTTFIEWQSVAILEADPPFPPAGSDGPDGRFEFDCISIVVASIKTNFYVLSPEGRLPTFWNPSSGTSAEIDMRFDVAFDPAIQGGDNNVSFFSVFAAGESQPPNIQYDVGADVLRYSSNKAAAAGSINVPSNVLGWTGTGFVRRQIRVTIRYDGNVAPWDGTRYTTTFYTREGGNIQQLDLDTAWVNVGGGIGGTESRLEYQWVGTRLYFSGNDQGNAVGGYGMYGQLFQLEMKEFVGDIDAGRLLSFVGDDVPLWPTPYVDAFFGDTWNWNGSGFGFCI